MFGRGSKLYSIFGAKCPRCHQGKLYKSSVFEGIYNMNKSCPKCNQDFEPEPGFYWGAMYIGYALSSAYMLGGTAIGIWVIGLTPMQSLTLAVAILVITLPLTARLARNIWINTNVRYNKKIADEVAEKERLAKGNGQ